MALTRITIRQCEAFVAVADTLSFVAAGERLGLTSSAVSQLVAELEGIVGFRLFDRSTRRVALSSAGRDFLVSAEAVLRHLQFAETSAADVRNRAAGLVRVGAPLVLAGYALPAAVQAFQKTAPKVAIHIRDVPVELMVGRVASGDLDLAVGPDRPPDTSILRQTIFSSPWVLWCAPAHPLAAKRTLRWEDLRNVALVAAGRDHEVSVAQMRINLPDNSAIIPIEVVDNITTALGIAAEGIAATLSPAYVGVVARPLGLTMRRVTEPETIRHVSLYRPSQRSIPPAAESFGAFLVDWMKRWSTKTAGHAWHRGDRGVGARRR